MKVVTKIELTAKELLEIIADRFNLDVNQSTIVVHKYDGDQRDPAYCYVNVEGPQK